MSLGCLRSSTTPKPPTPIPAATALARACASTPACQRLRGRIRRHRRCHRERERKGRVNLNPEGAWTAIHRNPQSHLYPPKAFLFGPYSVGCVSRSRIRLREVQKVKTQTVCSFIRRAMSCTEAMPVPKTSYFSLYRPRVPTNSIPSQTQLRFSPNTHSAMAASCLETHRSPLLHHPCHCLVAPRAVLRLCPQQCRLP